MNKNLSLILNNRQAGMLAALCEQREMKATRLICEMIETEFVSSQDARQEFSPVEEYVCHALRSKWPRELNDAVGTL